MVLLLQLLLILGVPGPSLASTSELGFGSAYDWYPTLITARPSQEGQADQPVGEKLHVIYGVTTTPTDLLHHDDDSAQQQQVEQQEDQQQQQQQQEQQQNDPQLTHEYQQYHIEQSPNNPNDGQQHLDYYQDTNYHHSYNEHLDENAHYSSHYSTNLIGTEPSRPQRPPTKQQISDKTWNVPAPYIKPNKNLIEDVSFNIGLILVVFIGFVVSLGAIAGAMTMKQNGGRALDLDSVAQAAVLQGIQKLEGQFGGKAH